MGPLQNNRAHYWRVRAKNASGWSAYSSSFSFGTLPAPSATTVSIRSSFTSPGSRPTGLAWDGRNLWMIDNLNNIFKMDPSGNVLATFKAPGFPDLDLSWDGTGLWIGGGQGYGSGRNYKVDSLGNRLDSLDVSHWAFSGFEWDGKFFWISDYNSSLIYKHARNGSVLLNFGVDISAARPNSLSYDGAHLWIGSPGSNINKYSTTGQLLARFNVSPLGISSTTSSVIAWDGESLWFAKTDQFTIYRLNVPYYHQAPSAPALASPADGATDLALTPTFTWNQSQDALTYRLQVSTNAAFTTLVFNDSTLTDTLKQVAPLSEGRTYYWRVNAKNSGGTSAFSGTRSFSTVGAPRPGTGVVHVSTSGNDANAGTPAAPLRNIQTALNRAGAGDTVKVALGTYTENLQTKVQVTLWGGYNYGFTDRDLFRNKVILKPATGTAVSDSTSSSIDGFIIDGSGGATSGLKVLRGHSKVTHNIVHGFFSGFGPGIHVLSGASAVVKSNSLANNKLSGGGTIFYAIYIDGNNNNATVLQNNIAYNNNVGIRIGPAGVQADYNCSFGNSWRNHEDGTTPGANDLIVDPRFVNPNATDFRLKASSPCIDAGNPSDSPGDEPPTKANRIDIGAYGGTKNATSPDLSSATHVSNLGSDSNPGTAAQPMRTIQNALNNAIGDTVKVAAGRYAESIVTPSKAVLVGGYSESFLDS
ncbi:MAG: DUF1565 domain-containing protein, partial [Ignavibacteriales bacterium]|nr:DUF1565 domain-containing protein [Ignavibacteriales bacterium]